MLGGGLDHHPPTFLMEAQSQNELNHLVEQAISQNPHLKKRELRFETHKGHVVLRGRVATFYQKQMAQEALRNVAGIQKIENALEVV